jgi:hypothetical protein
MLIVGNVVLESPDIEVGLEVRFFLEFALLCFNPAEGDVSDFIYGLELLLFGNIFGLNSIASFNSLFLQNDI